MNTIFTPLQDIKLQTIDFKWIQQTTKISHLKRAIRLIELDGNVYTQLKEACYARIGELDPAQKRIQIDNRMSAEDRENVNHELSEWECSLNTLNKVFSNQIFPKEDKEIDVQSYFSQDPSKVNHKKQAQNERNKGNEAIKSKDFQQAIKYYTKSIQLNPSMFQSYGNRALAYIKLKQFQKALIDCEAAIKINKTYTKAFHRKAKALIGLKNKVEAYSALQEALKIQPQNSECLAELKDLRQEMNQQQKGRLEGQSKFKKVVIEEDSQEQDEPIQG